LNSKLKKKKSATAARQGVNSFTNEPCVFKAKLSVKKEKICMKAKKIDVKDEMVHVKEMEVQI
jgi:hypothetical protein